MTTLTFDQLVAIPNAITDSRTPADYPETVFFAIRTSSDDGHKYLSEMYDKGIRAFVVSDATPLANKADAHIFISQNPRETLLQAATARRHLIPYPIVAITGSRGKTVVKEQINALLVGEKKVARSPRSWNSHIGVPLSLWHLDPKADIGIIEAGVSHQGEMSALAQAINPTIGVFTSLTDEHDEGFTSLEQKCREKALLFQSCSTIFYNNNNEVVDRVIKQLYGDRKLIGISGDNTSLSGRVAAYILGHDVSTAHIQPLSGRIDITPTPEGASVAFDYYATDNDGVATALDYLRRRTDPSRDIVAILGARVEDSILKRAGVTRVVSVGPGNGPDHYSDVHSLASALTTGDFRDATIYINGPEKSAYAALRDQLCSLRHITRLTVNLEALTHNFKQYRSMLPSHTGTIAMIKADAYGCGAIEVARTLQAAGADAFAVAVVDEGIALREAHVTRPILVLDPWCTNPHAIVSAGLQPTLISPDPTIPAALNDCVPEGQTLNVHVKLDTGMHRLGLEPNQIKAFCEMIDRFPKLKVASTFSHLSTADCLNENQYTLGQLSLFNNMSGKLEHHLGYGIKRHILNTAGTRRFGNTDHAHDLVRLGIGLYGIDPLAGTEFTTPLLTVASLTTTIIAITEYDAGATVGYGRHGVLTRHSRIATLPIGYADGLNRRLSRGAASFEVAGVMCPTVGNICMDLCMIDVTDCPEARVGSSVEIFGPQAPIQRLADTLGTIPYEVLTWVSPRVKRVYQSSI